MVKNPKQKGSNFERAFCKELSLWWSLGKDDNVFWRSQSSGGRATTRSKSNKRAEGQFGDIAANSESGKALIDLTMIELKRGYNSQTIFDLIDRPKTTAYNPHSLEGWIGKLEEALPLSGTYTWWLVHQRDRRRPILYMPRRFYLDLINFESSYFDIDRLTPWLEVIKAPIRVHQKTRLVSLIGFDLGRWFELVDPSKMRKLSKFV